MSDKFSRRKPGGPKLECPSCNEEFWAEDGPFCPYCETDLRNWSET